MSTLDALLARIAQDPTDPVPWMVVADWLEENDDPQRAELLRLHRSLPDLPEGAEKHTRAERIRDLLLAGVVPCVPRRTNGLGMQLALIPPGRFMMGSPESEPDRMDDEPLHDVHITRPFWMGVHLVTQKQYRTVMGTNPSTFTARRTRRPARETAQFPAESMSWADAVAFCARLSRREKTAEAGLAYRLPTEAEWEYACRAWNPVDWPFHFGQQLTASHANFDTIRPYPSDADLEKQPSLARPCIVGSYPPNAFGLYDMHGNLDEWVADWFDREYYAYSPQRDPLGPEEGTRKTIRGGSWRGQDEDCRAAVRIWQDLEGGENFVGFRVVLAEVQS